MPQPKRSIRSRRHRPTTTTTRNSPTTLLPTWNSSSGSEKFKIQSSKFKVQSREDLPFEEMRAAFASVDPFGGKGEPTAKYRALIRHLIRRYRTGERMAAKTA